MCLPTSVLSLRGVGVAWCWLHSAAPELNIWVAGRSWIRGQGLCVLIPPWDPM